METKARHLLVEYFGCSASALDDPERIRSLMRHAAAAARATVVAEVVHPYAPHGVTGVFVIKESHFSVHTWPEAGYAAVDFYTCGDCDPSQAAEVLGHGLGATRRESLLVHRGLHGARSIRTEPLLREPGPGLDEGYAAVRREETAEPAHCSGE